MQHAEQVLGDIWYPQFGHTVRGYGAPRVLWRETLMQRVLVIGVRDIRVIANSTAHS